MVGTEMLASRSFSSVTSTPITIAADDVRVLNGKVTETADTEDRDLLARDDVRDLDRLIGRDPSAGKRGRVERGDAVGNGDDEVRVGDGVFGEAPSTHNRCSAAPGTESRVR